MDKSLILILSLFCQTLFGQVTLQNASFQNAQLDLTNSAGGGGGGWTKVLSVKQGSTDGNGFTTTTPTNTSGATMFAVVETWFGSPRPAVSDSSGNTYKVAVIGDSGDGSPGSDGQIAILYATNLTTSSTTTWTLTGSGIFPAITIYAFSGGAGGVPDQTNSASNNGSGSTVQAGSVTPSTANQLVISGVYTRLVNPVSIDSSFATPVIVNAAGGACGGTGISFIVQGSATAVNPTWTGSGTDTFDAATATFK